MKTTIEVPDELLKKAKATAALRGESMREFITAALETRLASVKTPAADSAGWRSAFGLAERAEVAKVDRLVARDLERIDPSEWR